MRPQVIAEADAKETGPRFMGLPDRWFEPPGPRWRCANGHTMEWYIKSERLGYSKCTSCDSPVWLTFPEDKGVTMPLMLVSPKEILELKKEAYECNDARLMAVARALEQVQGDPYTTCQVLLTAFRELARDQRGLMEKLVKAVACLPVSPVIVLKEPPCPK